MKYYYVKKEIITYMYGSVYHCDHPLYDICTLYRIGEKGLSVIQQRYDEVSKTSWWCNIDDELVDDIYLNPNFQEYFNIHAREVDENGLYPTVTIRQIMWGLKMKPLKRAYWETRFY